MSIVLSIATPNSLTLIRLIQLDFTVSILLAALTLTVTGLWLDLMTGVVVGSISLPFVAMSLGMVLAVLVGVTHEVRIKNC